MTTPTSNEILTLLAQRTGRTERELLAAADAGNGSHGGPAGAALRDVARRAWPDLDQPQRKLARLVKGETGAQFWRILHGLRRGLGLAPMRLDRGSTMIRCGHLQDRKRLEGGRDDDFGRYSRTIDALAETLYLSAARGPCPWAGLSEGEQDSWRAAADTAMLALAPPAELGPGLMTAVDSRIRGALRAARQRFSRAASPA
jgi:hypothetical protein